MSEFASFDSPTFGAWTLGVASRKRGCRIGHVVVCRATDLWSGRRALRPNYWKVSIGGSIRLELLSFRNETTSEARRHCLLHRRGRHSDGRSRGSSRPRSNREFPDGSRDMDHATTVREPEPVLAASRPRLSPVKAEARVDKTTCERGGLARSTALPTTAGIDAGDRYIARAINPGRVEANRRLSPDSDGPKVCDGALRPGLRRGRYLRRRSAHAIRYRFPILRATNRPARFRLGRRLKRRKPTGCALRAVRGSHHDSSTRMGQTPRCPFVSQVSG